MLTNSKNKRITNKYFKWEEKWQMQLLYFITNHVEKVPVVLARLAEAGVNGATVVNCEGMAHMLATSGEAPALFGSLRSLFNTEETGEGKMVLAVMKDENILAAKEAIQSVCGSFDEPNTGVMFSVPVMHFEGVTKNRT